MLRSAPSGCFPIGAFDTRSSARSRFSCYGGRLLLGRAWGAMAVAVALLIAPAVSFSPGALRPQCSPLLPPKCCMRAGRVTALQGLAMKNYIPDRRGAGNKGSSSSEPPADDGAAAVEGQLLPKLGKLKDVTRQRRGDILGARGAVKVQGQRWENLVQKPPTIRVCGGTHKGRKLKRPDVYLRPMMGKVKEALFSIIQEFKVLREDAIALDSFSGCGSVGIEALSRGVGKAVFVDYSKEACRTIEDNLQACNFDDTRALVVCSKAESIYDAPQAVLSKMQKRCFDLVTITPPYDEIDYSDLLNRVATSEALLGDGSVVVVEYPVELGSLPPTIGSKMIGMRNRKYGRTMVAIYCVNPAVEMEARAAEFGSLRLDYLENGKVQLQGGGGGGGGGGGEAGEARAPATTWARENDQDGAQGARRRREGGRGTVGGRGGGQAGK